MRKKYITPTAEAILLDTESPILNEGGSGSNVSLPTGEEKVEQGSKEMGGGWSSSDWTDE